MEAKKFDIDGTIWKRISKRTARKMFNDGAALMVKKDKANPYSMWKPYSITQKSELGFDDFDKMVHSFEFYNSYAELGDTTEFYIQCVTQ